MILDHKEFWERWEEVSRKEACFYDGGDGRNCPGCRDVQDGVIVEQRQHRRIES